MSTCSGAACSPCPATLSVASSAQRATLPSFSIPRTSARSASRLSSLCSAGSPDCATTVRPPSGADMASVAATVGTVKTLHTVNAGETVNRILGMFEAEDQEQIRIRLADSLRWIVSQRLAPKIGGGRCALLEIMGHNLRTEETVRLGESEGKTFYEIIEASYTFGWRTFDQACIEAFEKGVITEENALLYCSKRGVVSRGIDNIKKERGEITSTVGSLKMRSGGQSEGEPVPPGSGLKLK